MCLINSNAKQRRHRIEFQNALICTQFWMSIVDENSHESNTVRMRGVKPQSRSYDKGLKYYMLYLDIDASMQA